VQLPRLEVQAQIASPFPHRTYKAVLVLKQVANKHNQ
jgi:hypothetical protein